MNNIKSREEREEDSYKVEVEHRYKVRVAKMRPTYVIYGLERVGYILNENYRELIELVNNSEKELYGELYDSKELSDSIQNELIRLLFNYASSVVASIDYTKSIKNRIGNRSLSDRWDRESRKMRTSGAGFGFMKDYRNFVLHVDSPYICFYYVSDWMEEFEELEDGGFEADTTMTCQVSFIKEDLLKWDGWVSTCKKYIYKCNNYIGVKQEVSRCQEDILKFLAWFKRDIVNIGLVKKEN